MRSTLAGLAALAMMAMAAAHPHVYDLGMKKRAPVPQNAAGRCGPDGNGASCTSSQCCSAAGYCGKGSDYCTDPDCQYQYGICDSNTTPAGASTLNDARPKLGSITYADDIYDCIADNVVALTYDDGPYQYTSALLDVLKKYKFSATFFITGNNLGKGPIDTTAPYPDIIKRMIAEGHQVASHTWSHYSLSTLSTAMRRDQMAKNERALANIIGKYPTYMRPPFSDCTPESGCTKDLTALGYHRVYFDLDTEDYLHDDPSQIQQSKDIVRDALFGAGKDATDYLSIEHDIHQQTVANLSTYFFDQIVQKGWKGVTVGECLQDDPKNWYRTPSGGAASTVVSSSSVPQPSSSSAQSTPVVSSSVPVVTTSAVPTSTSVPVVTVTVTTKRTTSTSSAKPTTTKKDTGTVIIIPGITTITIPGPGPRTTIIG